jgi:hypothetical protein
MVYGGAFTALRCECSKHSILVPRIWLTNNVL